MTDCLFCGIVDGELASHTVLEDDQTMAFLDVNPVTRGHTLVVLKEHTATINDTDASSVAAVGRSVKRVADGIDQALDPDGINILQSNGAVAGQEVDHLHFHVIPRYDGDGIELPFEQGELQEPEEVAMSISTAILD